VERIEHPAEGAIRAEWGADHNLGPLAENERAVVELDRVRDFGLETEESGQLRGHRNAQKESDRFARQIRERSLFESIFIE
jgi:hypothetical protein